MDAKLGIMGETQGKEGAWMKKFFATHSYSMVKMFLNQFAIGIFGFAMTLATTAMKNGALRNICGVGSVVFYLFLIYNMTWEIGYKDRQSVLVGKKSRRIFTGGLISLCANIPNFIFAIFITLATFIQVEAVGNVGAICKFLALLLEGMYTGLMMNTLGGVALNMYWWVFFLLPIPAIVTSFVAYWMGLEDKRLTKLSDPLIPESDRDPTSKKKTWTLKDDEKPEEKKDK